MFDLDNVGGVPVVLRSLLRKGLLHGEAMTVTGKTMRANLDAITVDYNQDEKVVKHLDNPISDQGTLKILKGTLAPHGAVVKVAGVKNKKFRGKARIAQVRHILQERPSCNGA